MHHQRWDDRDAQQQQQQQQQQQLSSSSQCSAPFKAVNYVQSSIEEWNIAGVEPFDLITCCMTLQFVWDLKGQHKQPHADRPAQCCWRSMAPCCDLIRLPIATFALLAFPSLRSQGFVPFGTQRSVRDVG